MLIWRGWGILVVLAAFAGLLVADFVTRAVMHDEHYYSAHPLPKLVGALLATAFAFGVAKLLEKRNTPRTVIDKATGQEILLRRGDSFFFIPVRFLPYVILLILVIVAFVSDK